MPKLEKSDAKSIDEVGGRDRPKAGFFHVAIHHWDETYAKKDEVITEYQVLAGTTPGQDGKVHHERNGLKRADGGDNTDNFDANLRRILVSTEVIGLNDALDRDVTQEVLGRQCVIELAEREYEKDGKKKTAVNIGNFGRNIWPIGHPDVAHVPLNKAAVSLLAAKQPLAYAAAMGKQPPPAGTTAPIQPTPPTQPPTAAPVQPAAAAPVASAWSQV